MDVGDNFFHQELWLENWPLAAAIPLPALLALWRGWVEGKRFDTAGLLRSPVSRAVASVSRNGGENRRRKRLGGGGGRKRGFYDGFLGKPSFLLFFSSLFFLRGVGGL